MEAGNKVIMFECASCHNTYGENYRNNGHWPWDWCEECSILASLFRRRLRMAPRRLFVSHLMDHRAQTEAARLAGVPLRSTLSAIRSALPVAHKLGYGRRRPQPSQPACDPS